ncbi:MAG: undecaprenyl/decaprenyl-phosphate alpha-N-acetylglucosaminyl 1-phosphate transferase [Oscillospiraceae bacterium]|nr:undecaprenyl/decaprenyl-phosphate alpha-N-acetylglucosaminyl 1-phosphate transferase [Oscillospiraceae bacterium]
MLDNVPFMIMIAITFLVGGIIAFAASPLVRKFAHIVGAIDVPRDARRVHKTPIPRLGGLAIFLGFLAAVLLFARIDDAMRGILLGATVIIALGVIDDIINLPAWIKFIVQIVAALIPVLHGVTIEFLSNPIFFNRAPEINLGFLSAPLTVLWIVLITNSVNLIDGLDGLAVGVSAISSISLLIISIVLQEPNVPLIVAALAGACIGFMPYNFNPAKMFMGDTGATFLGFMLATISVTGLFKFYTVISFAVPLLILALPIFDTISSIIRRLLRGKSPMSPDRGHVHHRLIDMGFSQKQSVVILYALSSVLAFAAVVLSTAIELKGIIFIIAVIVAIAISVRLFGRKKPPGNGANGANGGNGGDDPTITKTENDSNENGG